MGISQQIGASSLSKPGVCTSSTRPATPYEGQMIYETDTDKVLVYNGSAWYANWNLPWGIVALATSTSTFTVTTTPTISTGMTVTFTAIANRYYRISYYEAQARAVAGAGGYVYTFIKKVNAAGTQLSAGIVYSTSATGAIGNLNVVAVTTLTAGSQTIVGAAYCSSGTTTLDRDTTYPAYLLVEDIGVL